MPKAAISQKEKELRFDLVEHGFLRCATCPFARGLDRSLDYRARCAKGKKVVLVPFAEASVCEIHESLTIKSFKLRRLPKK